MRLRVLLTNGSKTIDFLWLRHDGSDIYYGLVGASGHKGSYHASGARHAQRSAAEPRLVYDKHHPLDAFSGHIQLQTIMFNTGFIEKTTKTQFQGKKSDPAVYLDTRTLPKLLSISFGLLEPGNYGALPAHDADSGLCQLSIVTNVSPWIYVMVIDQAKERLSNEKS